MADGLYIVTASYLCAGFVVQGGSNYNVRSNPQEAASLLEDYRKENLMLGLLLASTLIISCTVVNFDPRPTLVCSDKTVRYVSYADWPENWHGPELGFTYQLEIQANGEVFTLASMRDERKLAQDIQRARSHQRRFMREALQNPKKEP